MNTEKTKFAKPSLSIGVVTHDRSVAFSKLLQYLIPSIEHYEQHCEVVVANNSGEAAHQQIDAIVAESGLRSLCECRVIDSTKNNISIGRNIILDHARETHVVFIDDDEYPEPTWLVELVDAMYKLNCTLVAGPILPVFPASVTGWVTQVDLHNTHGLITGDLIDYAASGNFLMNRHGVETIRFAESLGKSGGEDTDFFLQLKDHGHQLYWCSEAVVHEDIPFSKSTPEYMTDRFMTQGRSYRSIREQRGEMGNVVLFTLRAVLLALVSIAVARLLILVRPAKAAKWMKRGYANLGKFVKPNRHLYE